MQLISHHPLLPQIIAETFHWKIAKDPLGGPVAWVDTGREIVSLPHFSYGAWPDGITDGNLLKNLSILRENIRQLQLHTGKKYQWRIPAFSDQEETTKVCSWLELKRPWYNSHLSWPGNLGRKIRKAFDEGLRVREGGRELLEMFYKVYELRLHEIGSAALPLIFFKNLLESYPDSALKADARIFIVTRNAETLGGAFCLKYDTFIENTWFATLARYQKLYTSYLLHAAMIEYAANSGCKVYSFGRSTRNSGVHRFKKQWGTEDVALYWIQIPEPKISLRNFPGLLKLWKNVPLGIARSFNPWLASRFY